MLNVVFNRNCVYQTAYHVIWCPRFRKDVLVGLVATTLASVLKEICEEKGWPLFSHEIQPDHVHLFVSVPPATAVANVIKQLKGITARRLFMIFPELKKKLWDGGMWSPSYYVGTAGNVSAETIRHYIERTEHVTKRR